MANIDKSKGEFCIGFKISNSSVVYVYHVQLDAKTPRALYFFCNQYYANRAQASTGSFVPDAVQEANADFAPFFKKWIGYQRKTLTPKQVAEINAEITALKKTGAPFIESKDGDDYLDLQRPGNAVELIKAKPHKAYRIKWDTDGASLKECGLPTSVIVPFYMDEDEVSDWLSDTFGFCHDGFCTNF